MGDTRRILVLAVVLAGLAMGSPALAHNDHEALGAGPGPANATMPAPRKAEASNGHMEMGSMRAPGEAGMEHGGNETESANKSFGQRLVSWLGRLHTMVIHFPIAMFIGAFAVEVFGLWRGKRDYQHAAYIMLIVGSLGAIVAAFLGWFAGGFYLTDRNPVLMAHRWLGTGIAIFGFILVFLATASRTTPERPRGLFLSLLGILVVAIAIQGFLGATFMHGGLRHLAF